MSLDKIAVLVGVLSGLVSVAGVLHQFRWKKSAAGVFLLGVALFLVLLLYYTGPADLTQSPPDEFGGPRPPSHARRESEHRDVEFPAQERGPLPPQRERWNEVPARRMPAGRHFHE